MSLSLLVPEIHSLPIFRTKRLSLCSITMYLGAGKHPSPLGKKKKKKKKKKKNRAHLINEFSSKFHKSSFLPHQKILFLSKVMLVFLPAPIYEVNYVRDDIQIDIYRYHIFCGQKGGIFQAAFYKIEI